MKKQYYIRKDLINKWNVSITFDYDNHRLHIKFSKDIEDELSKWKQSRVNDLIDDIRNALEYWFLYQPMNDRILNYVYEEVFTNLNQIY